MRQHHRLTFRSLFRARVFLRETSELMGYVSDISESGLRMRGDQLIATNSEHLCRIKVRKDEDNYLEFNVALVCVWSRENLISGHIETGFTLAHENAAYQAFVAELVQNRLGKLEPEAADQH